MLGFILSNKRKAISVFSALFIVAISVLYLTSCVCNDKWEHFCEAGDSFRLTIAMEGTGSGRVSSLPDGIFCETDCAEDYISVTEVTLTAAAYSGSDFIGWSGGGCTGAAECTLSLEDDTTVTAHFELAEIETLTLIPPYVNESDMREIRDFFNAEYTTLPWGRIHDGLDVYPDGNLKPFQAACSGRVTGIFVANEQVSVFIACNAIYSIGYHFESQAPDTGLIQLENISVTEGQLVSQGDVIGSLYSAENVDRAHVHFSLYTHAVQSCPEPYFSLADKNSILNLISVSHDEVVMCLSGDVTFPSLIAPYVSELDMKEIKAGFSSEYSASPWAYVNDGFDIYPQGDMKAFQASCTGVVDTVALQQVGVDSHWQVKVLINCNDFVFDPEAGGYFTPLSVEYIFETLSSIQLDGQAQLDNIMVAQAQEVSQGELIGFLNVLAENAHVQFSVFQFGNSEFLIYGVVPIPVCAEVHLTTQSKNSILNLLQLAWPTANLCYQN